MVKHRKTHCVHGHEFNEETSYFDRDGSRRCRLCMNRQALEYYWRNKEELKRKKVLGY